MRARLCVCAGYCVDAQWRTFRGLHTTALEDPHAPAAIWLQPTLEFPSAILQVGESAATPRLGGSGGPSASTCR